MKNKRMVITLFLSYIILIIPMLGISYFVSDYMISVMRKQADERIQQESISFVRKLDEALVEYRDKAVLLAAVTQLEANKMMSHGNATKEGLEYLQNIKMMDELLDNLLLLYGNNAYTPEGYWRLRTFLERGLGCEENYLQLGETVLAQKESAVVLIRGNNWDYLIFHYPIIDRRSAGTASINFIIRTEEVYEMLESMLEQVSVGIRLTFSNQWQEESIYLKGSMDTEEGLSEIDRESFQLLLEEKNWVVKAESSENLGMELQVYYDAKEIYQQITVWKKINEICMLVLLLASILISYKISSNHYQRIYHLKESLSNVWPQGAYTVSGRWENDFDSMHSMIRSIGAEADRMKTETENIRATMKQQAAMLLFYGGIREESSIVGMLEGCGIELQEPYYTVACIMALGKEKLPLPSLDRLLRENLACISKVEDCQALLVLFELPNEDFLKKQRDLLAQKLQQLAGEEYPLKIGFSQTYESLLRAPGAYLEAVGISQKLLHTKEQSVGYMDTVTGAGEQGIWFPEGAMERFENAIMRGELQLAQNALDVLLAYIRRSDFPEENKQYLRYSLVQSMLLGLQNREECREGEVLEKLAGIDVVDEAGFEEKIRESLGQVCRQEEQDRKVNFSRIVEYINSNYHRYDLSLEDVAEYAGLSKAYLSRLFKEKTGCKYIEYLIRCRMEHAKKLLDETDFDVQEIAAMVGYLNVSGFRNKFKEHYGVNASEYRKNRQEAYRQE